MVRRWIPLVACAAGAIWLSACSSDTPSSSTDSSSSTVLAPTATTLPAATTTAPAAPAAEVTTTTTAATGSTDAGAAGTPTTVAARVVTSPSDSVKLGDSGDGVKQIQTALKAKGYNVVVDSQFGPQTDSAVRAFQKKNGLTQDGVVGPKTWAKLSGSGDASGGSSTSTTVVADSTTTTTG